MLISNDDSGGHEYDADNNHRQNIAICIGSISGVLSSAISPLALNRQTALLLSMSQGEPDSLVASSPGTPPEDPPATQMAENKPDTVNSKDSSSSTSSNDEDAAPAETHGTPKKTKDVHEKDPNINVRPSSI